MKVKATKDFISQSHGNIYGGSVIECTDEFAQHLIDNGLAEAEAKPKPKAEPKPKKTLKLKAEDE